MLSTTDVKAPLVEFTCLAILLFDHDGVIGNSTANNTSQNHSTTSVGFLRDVPSCSDAGILYV